MDADELELEVTVHNRRSENTIPTVQLQRTVRTLSCKPDFFRRESEMCILSYILSIENDQVVVKYFGPRVITSVRDFHEFLSLETARLGVSPDELKVFASSTMDFPEEYTSNPETIVLARAVRGPSPWSRP
jgi:hypothetical protein